MPAGLHSSVMDVVVVELMLNADRYFRILGAGELGEEGPISNSTLNNQNDSSIKVDSENGQC